MSYCSDYCLTTARWSNDEINSNYRLVEDGRVCKTCEDITIDCEDYNICCNDLDGDNYSDSDSDHEIELCEDCFKSDFTECDHVNCQTLIHIGHNELVRASRLPPFKFYCCGCYYGVKERIWSAKNVLRKFVFDGYYKFLLIDEIQYTYDSETGTFRRGQEGGVLFY